MDKQKNPVKLDIVLTDEQKTVKSAILDGNKPYIFLTGVAGTSKTFLACAVALDLLFKKQIDKIVITRPTVSTEDNGFLPGTLEEKLEPWMVPIRENMRTIYNKPDKLQQLERDKIIEIVPLTFFRGRTMSTSVCIIDECFPKNTRIITSNGLKTILNIVNSVNKGIDVSVLSYNSELDIFEYKPVVNTMITDNREIFEVSFKDVKIQCTDNHKILTVHGYKMANELKVGDIAVFNGDSNKSSIFIDNNDIKNVLIGSLMGDGWVQNLGFGVYRFKLTHGIKQSNYCQWKIKMLYGKSRDIENNGYAKTKATVGMSKSFIVDGIDLSDKSSLIDYVTWQSLAISWMDDGTMSKYLNAGTLWSFPLDKNLTYKLSDKLNSMGLETSVSFQKNKYYVIRFNKKSIYILSEQISKYVHPDLAYKIHPDFRHLCNTYNWNNDVKNFTVKPFTGMKSLERFETVYDIEVKDNHNFIVQNTTSNKCGLVVHNCQNLTVEQLKMALTRLGKNSIMIFCGDTDQIDLKKKTDSALTILTKLEDSEDVSIFTLKENHRHPAIIRVLKLINGEN